MRVLLIVVALAASCGYAPCPEHTHSAEPGVCVADCGWQPGPDGVSAVPLSEECGAERAL